ncbi:MAG: trypsin-like peptidase domain-containing protein [Pseudohongiellaceae bacterium]
MRETDHPSLYTRLTGVALRALLATGLVAAVALGPVASPAKAQTTVSGQDYDEFFTDDEQNNIQVFEQASPSVVYITSSRLVRRSFFTLNPEEIPQGSGSGFIWNDEGYVVTNFHVIRNASRLNVTLQSGNTYEAEVVGVAPDQDLAVLRIDAADDELHPVTLGDSTQLAVGRKVIAIGNPFGLDTTLTVGVVSALGREINSVTRRRIRDVIQTDAAINPGNSGGPLLNSLGELIGVNTAIYSPSGASSGIGFAIPVNTVKSIIPELIEYGRVQTPRLGVSMFPPQQEAYYQRRWGIEGVIVLDVIDGLSPDRAGMRGLQETARGLVLGDVIVQVEDIPVRNQDDLLAVLEAREAGDVIEVITRRDGERQRYEIELQAPRGQ